MHRGLTEDSQRTHRALTEDSQRARRGPTQRLHQGFAEDLPSEAVLDTGFNEILPASYAPHMGLVLRGLAIKPMPYTRV